MGRKWLRSQGFWDAGLLLQRRESDVLKQLALFAFAGLLTAFLLVSYGPDLSAGFF
jgi:hypothetical protein